jgi:hypothetical protein
MNYGFIYTQIQRMKIEQEAQPHPKWELHRPTVSYSFRRIRILARQFRHAEYALAARIAAEIKLELQAIEERLIECASPKEGA